MLKTLIPVATALAMTFTALTPVSTASALDGPERWWPEILDLSALRANDPRSNPLGADFDYAAAFQTLDLDAVKADIEKVMTDSQDWWPADYGHYGPFFIRMAWHGAGTYRVSDGRGGAGMGMQRFEPLNSWPDNTNLDKARRLLWPVKAKYGDALSWADLMILTGNVALESMGFETYGFAGGRADRWEPEMAYWGPEPELGTSGARFAGNGKLGRGLAATIMGLIYVNPEGPNGSADIQASADRIRETFGNMAMNDEETVALIAGGHTFGKMHGARKGDCKGAEPAAAGVEKQGLGWHSKCGTGKGADTVTSGLEGAWTQSPIQWTSLYLDNLFTFDWKQTESPAGAIQFIPTDESMKDAVPDAHVEGKFHAPVMLVTDLALKTDPAYRKVAKRFQENPDEYAKAFAKAWYKLTHRDMGPRARYLGKFTPEETLIWQDPITEPTGKPINRSDIKKLKKELAKSGLSTQELVRTAWASASTFRDSDMRGGANGARIRLEPQSGWAVNNPSELSEVLTKLGDIQETFNKKSRRDISLADMIVLGGAYAIEKAALEAGHKVSVPFKPGRGDATVEQTDANSFAVLEPKNDAFRNFHSDVTEGHAQYGMTPSMMMIDRADLLGLTVPEMTVLVGGMRALDANTGGAKHGVFTDKPGTLSNDFFTNLLDMGTVWKASGSEAGVYEGRDRQSGEMRWTATEVDLVFGSNAELRAVAEVYAFDDAGDKFVKDFVAAWTKVMNADRF